jgi:hypothetical protein
MSVVWTAAGGANDNGSCCGTRAAIQGNIYDITGTAGKTAAKGPSKTDTDLLMWNSYTCVAWKNA